jgi:Tol biopolymer transport system component
MKNIDRIGYWTASVWAPVVFVLWLVVGGCGGQADNASKGKEASTTAATTASSETTADGSQATTAAAPRVTRQGSTPRRLAIDILPMPFSLSPAGDKVSFYKWDSNLYVINSDGTNLINVTKGALTQYGSGGEFDFNHTFSPDGNQIILASHEDINSGNSDLFMVNSDGTNLTKLTATKAKAEQNPAFSPDGSKIVFVRCPITWNPPPRCEVYVMETDGTNQKRLTDDIGIKLMPAFYAGGEKIAFMRIDEYTPFSGVYAMDADGSNQRELLEGVPGIRFLPAFSPDGEKIAFVASERPAFPRKGQPHPELEVDVYVANVDGSDVSRLTHRPGFDHEPAFVPGTDMVAFVSERSGNKDIYAMRLDGTGLTNLTDTDSADEFYPTFSADGTKMAYQRVGKGMSSRHGIYMMHIEKTATDGG